MLLFFGELLLARTDEAEGVERRSCSVVVAGGVDFFNRLAPSAKILSSDLRLFFDDDDADPGDADVVVVAVVVAAPAAEVAASGNPI